MSSIVCPAGYYKIIYFILQVKITYANRILSS